MAADRPTHVSGSENRQMKALVISRLSPVDRDRVVAAARTRRVSVSTLIRTAVLKEIAG